MACVDVGYYEKIATIAAIIAGGGFFLWKIFTGWLIANFDVSVTLERQANDNKTDFLKVDLDLNKGNVDSVRLTEVSFRVFDINHHPIGNPVYVTDFFRRDLTPNGGIDWQSPLTNIRFSISTDETFKYSRIIRVPVEEPVIVEVCVCGKRLFWRKAQWRSSSAAMPVNTSVTA